jgi:hypothetical protein
LHILQENGAFNEDMRQGRPALHAPVPSLLTLYQTMGSTFMTVNMVSVTHSTKRIEIKPD